MKKTILSLVLVVSINAVLLHHSYAQEVTASRKASAGVGFGIPYGVLGIGGEYPVAENLNVSAGIGTTILAGAGYCIGVKYYLKDAKKTWRPRVAAYYGTNSVLQEERFGTSEKTYTGLALGIGQRWMWGASKRHGFDLDLLYLVTSGIFDRADELEARGQDVSGTGRIKISFGYRYGF